MNQEPKAKVYWPHVHMCTCGQIDGEHNKNGYIPVDNAHCYILHACVLCVHTLLCICVYCALVHMHMLGTQREDACKWHSTCDHDFIDHSKLLEKVK